MSDIEAAERANAWAVWRGPACDEFKDGHWNAYVAGWLARSALAHATRGEGEAINSSVAGCVCGRPRTPGVVHRTKGPCYHPTPPPATGEGEVLTPDVPEGTNIAQLAQEQRNANRTVWIKHDATGEDVGERQRFLAWWHGHDAVDYYAFPEETTKCVAYAAWCGRARALRAREPDQPDLRGEDREAVEAAKRGGVR